MATMYYERDCNLSLLDGKKVAVIGYGSQGHAHALNLRDSGVDVVVGLYEGSKSAAKAKEDGFTVMLTADAVKAADIIMILVNDEKQAALYKKDIKDNLTAGKTLAFAHGFNIHFKQIVPPADVNVIMIAPKGPGHTVRSQYVGGKGVPCLVAVEQDPAGNSMEVAKAYAAGIRREPENLRPYPDKAGTAHRGRTLHGRHRGFWLQACPAWPGEQEKSRGLRPCN